MCTNFKVNNLLYLKKKKVKFIKINFIFYRIANVNYDYLDTAENLQVKLSLKKQIWTGTHSETNDKPRPLSWGVLPVVRKKNNNISVDENEDLLL